MFSDPPEIPSTQLRRIFFAISAYPSFFLLTRMGVTTATMSTGGGGRGDREWEPPAGGKGGGICNNFLKGICARGNCRFSHDASGESAYAPRSSGKGKGKSNGKGKEDTDTGPYIGPDLSMDIAIDKWSLSFPTVIFYRYFMSDSKSGVASAHVRNVMLTTGIGLCVAGGSSYAHVSNLLPPELHGGIMMTLVQVVCIALLGTSSVCCSRSGFSFPLFLLFLACAFAAGANVGTWVDHTLQESGLCEGEGLAWLPDADIFSPTWSKADCSNGNNLVLQASAITAALYFSFFISALLSTPGEWSYRLGSLIPAGSIILSISYLARVFGVTWGFDLIYIQFGLVFYCFKILYDTEVMCANAKAGQMDVIGDALTSLLNILQMFIRVIDILVTIKKSMKSKQGG